MKKNVLFFMFLSSLFISCDKEYTYNYCIKNTCSETIKVVANIPHLGDIIERDIEILPQESKVLQSSIVYVPISDIGIEGFFSKFEVSKNGRQAKINLDNSDYWVFNQEDRYNATYTLTVKPEYFD